jgi:carboxyl-terminal processing protease
MTNKRLSLITKLSLVFLLSVNVLFTSAQNTNYFETSKNIEIFTDLYKELDLFYVDEVNSGDLIKTAIDQMLKSLDPYTTYIPESDIEDYRFMTTGQYGGIGSMITKRGEYVFISEPYEGFPAQKAGLMAGDKIVEVNGKSAKGKSTEELSSVLKGQPNTEVTVLLERDGELLTKTFKREKVTVKSVPYYGFLKDGIAYIKLRSFTRNCANDIKDALTDLKSQQELKGIVLDLRSNPGGLLNESIDIVNLFVEKGEEIVVTKGKIKDWEKSYKARKSPEDLETPLIVLINSNSASASEIVSGSIQDLDRGVIIGRRSYGKGLVQQTRKLSYNSQLKVTVAKYYIPSGRCIQAIDYAHKDEDGNPKKIPDSLLTEFKTQNGRLVLDGAGIKPDVEKNRERYGAITRALLSKNHVFNFATQYVLKHDSISNAKNFRLTDDEYQSFITYLLDNEYDYQTSTGKGLKALKKRAEKDSILVDIASEIKLIEDKIILKKKSDLKKFKSQIKGFLEIEIASRYFFQIGKIESSLGNDFFVDEAVEILTNNERYTSILSGN